jgi:sec-independent protein translocase protein TatB
MAEFRRASNEFRMQMEDELRMSEQAEQQKKIAEMEAAAPVTPAITDGSEYIDSGENTGGNTIDANLSSNPGEDPIEEHPHMHPFGNEDSTDWNQSADSSVEAASEPVAEPLPIATSGDLDLMPPSTGLPVASSSISQAFASIPHAPEPNSAPVPDSAVAEAPIHG